MLEWVAEQIAMSDAPPARIVEVGEAPDELSAAFQTGVRYGVDHAFDWLMPVAGVEWAGEP
jgi:hypothetical protein